jgi:hypothetical protein
VSNEEIRERRLYLKRALEEAQSLLDSYTGDTNGRHDLSKRIGLLWNAYAGCGGNWRDLENVRRKQRAKK